MPGAEIPEATGASVHIRLRSELLPCLCSRRVSERHTMRYRPGDPPDGEEAHKARQQLRLGDRPGDSGLAADYARHAVGADQRWGAFWFPPCAPGRQEKLRASLEKINRKFGADLRRLAE